MTPPSLPRRPRGLLPGVAVVAALAACDPARIANPPGPVAEFVIAPPPVTATFRPGDTLDLRTVITSAVDGYGRPVRVAGLRPRWAVAREVRGVAVAEGEGLDVLVPDAGPGGVAYVFLWVVGEVPPDGTAEAGFAINVAR